MNITDVRIRKVNDEGKMKAVVSITFDDEFVVHDIKIIEGQNGLFIAMPSRKMGEGDFRDIAHPLVSETRNKIRDAIFDLLLNLFIVVFPVHTFICHRDRLIELQYDLVSDHFVPPIRLVLFSSVIIIARAMYQKWDVGTYLILCTKYGTMGAV